MKESCYCGRTGEIEEREPILNADGRRALACPDCGHLDCLEWLADKASLLLWEEALRRRESQTGRRPAA